MLDNLKRFHVFKTDLHQLDYPKAEILFNYTLLESFVQAMSAYEKDEINVFDDVLGGKEKAGVKSTNETEGITGEESQEKLLFETIFTILLSLLLGALILCTIIGNLFVILAILKERNLRTVGNYLLLSLAIADLMVACLVMPLGAVYEVSTEWRMGEIVCDIWTSTDILCCTASILHLLAIAIDRYWAVTNIDYIHNRNSNRIWILIGLIWTVSTVISVAPILGFKDPDFKHRVEVEKRCIYSQDVTYQIIATGATFYGPLILILFLYWRIYQVARKRIRRKPGNKVILTIREASEVVCKNDEVVQCPQEIVTTNYSSCELSVAGTTTTTNTTTTTMGTLRSNSSLERNNAIEDTCVILEEGEDSTSVRLANQEEGEAKEESAVRNASLGRTEKTIALDNGATSGVAEGVKERKRKMRREEDLSKKVKMKEKEQKMSSRLLPNSAYKRRGKKSYGACGGGPGTRESLESKRERKAAKTLAIITGVFVVCWLPFFVVTLLMSLCGDFYPFPAMLFNICLWLGWINSMLNPIIYTIFSMDFRTAFKKILCGRQTGHRFSTRV